MANLPVRELGKVGVLPDSNPYNIPLNGFSDANNVVFREGNFTRAPVFKQLYPAVKSSKTWAEFGTDSWDSASDLSYESAEGASTAIARFVASFGDATSGETILVCDNDGSVRAYPNGILQNVTVVGAGTVTNEESWAHAQVSGVSFLSRPGMVPYARNLLSDSTYKSLGTSNWGTTTTCSVIRAYNDFAVALNVTKGSTAYPTMVKWCDPLQYGSAVTGLDWDATSTTNSAGENVLGEMTTPIKDGLKLGTQFIIYSDDQVWIMEYTGSSLVFNFRRLFSTGGIIATNCVVEVEGKHFVFGVDDIYVHDGATKKSIADNRVRRYIYKNLDVNKSKSFFVVHDPVGSFIYFCFYSRRDEIGYPKTAFCNRAAIYNYREDNWSFMDLPNIVGGAEAKLNLSSYIYPSVTGSYADYNTAYLAFDSTTPKFPVMLGITDTTHNLSESRVYALDLPMLGAINLPVHPETSKPAYVSRTGIDMDELQLPLRGYKYINSVVPQAEYDVSYGTFYWEIGATDLAGGPVVYSTAYDYKPSSDYIINSRAFGRYLAYKVTMNYADNFRFSGFDLDVLSLNRR
jgi:hypothetical protein